MPDEKRRTDIHSNNSDATRGRRTDGRQSVPTTDPDESLFTFFIPTLEGGGAESVTVNIVNGLSNRGYNVELLLSRFEREWRSKLASGVSVTELSPTYTSVFGITAHIPALVSYLRREAPTALFPHLTHVNVLSLAVARVLDTDIKIFPTHHLMFGAKSDATTRDRVASTASRHLYPSANRIITVSQGVADSIVDQTNVTSEDVSVLYNPIDVDSIRNRVNEPVDHKWLKSNKLKTVLFVGRLEKQKDLKTWLRVFKQVHERDPETRAIIVGEGDLREEYRAFADKIGVGDVVSMPGYVSNQYTYMYYADLFFLSSRFEGLPTVLIEALACGCPIVSTDCPCGPREILVDGEYGELISPGNTEELADAVLSTLADPPPKYKLKERANAFALDTVLDEYEHFIEEYVVSQ